MREVGDCVEGDGDPGDGQHERTGGPFSGPHLTITRVSLSDVFISIDKISFRFQSRIHLLEESRAFAIIHQKKQEWYQGLPAAARSQKQTNTRNKYRVNRQRARNV